MSQQFPDILAIQCVITAPTGMPRDQVVTRFTVFDAPPGGAGRLDRCEAFVRSFFFATEAGATPVGQYMPANYTPMRIRVYDLGLPQPRVPLVRTLTGGTPAALFTGTATTALPSELAACITWKTDINPPRPGEVGLRARGRNYIGPLVASAITAGTGRSHLSGPFRIALAAAGKRALAGLQLLPVVTSEKYGSVHPVVSGWVDNAPDIQRRRGTDANARTNFTSAGWTEVVV